MKKNLIYLLVFTFAFVSCKKDDDKVSVNKLSAKWEISDKNSPYSSFEFNKDGNYIVVANDVGTSLRSSNTSLKSSLFNKKTSNAKGLRSSESDSNLSPIHFGTYTIEGNKIILSGFGLIETISITAEEFTFSFTLESTGEKNSFVASKSAEPISSSSRTEMFCRTWVIRNLTDVNGKELDYWGERDDIIGSIILFSKAGTYLVLYGGEGGDAGLSEWKWANKEETKLYYSWENWTDNWEEENIVTINQLSNNALVFQENIDGLGDVIYHLSLKN